MCAGHSVKIHCSLTRLQDYPYLLLICLELVFLLLSVFLDLLLRFRAGVFYSLCSVYRWIGWSVRSEVDSADVGRIHSLAIRVVSHLVTTGKRTTRHLSVRSSALLSLPMYFVNEAQFVDSWDMCTSSNVWMPAEF